MPIYDPQAREQFRKAAVGRSLRSTSIDSSNRPRPPPSARRASHAQMRYNPPLKGVANTTVASDATGAPTRREETRKRRRGSLSPPQWFDFLPSKFRSNKANSPTEDRLVDDEEKREKERVDQLETERNQTNCHRGRSNSHPRSTSLPDIDLGPGHMDLLSQYSRCSPDNRRIPSVLEREEEEEEEQAGEEDSMVDRVSFFLENPDDSSSDVQKGNGR